MGEADFNQVMRLRNRQVNAAENFSREKNLTPVLIGDNRNLFLKLKSKLGLYHVVLTSPKTSPEKLTLTVFEMQQLPDIEKSDSKEEKSCLKWTRYNDRRKVRVNFQTDTDKLNIVVYRYRNNL